MKKRFGKAVTMLVLGALAALALAAPAMAQKAAEMKAAHKMMSDGWKMYNDGQRMVIKGVEMNNLVAVQGASRTRWFRGTRSLRMAGTPKPSRPPCLPRAKKPL